MRRWFSTHEELEAAAESAENLWKTGKWHTALDLYCEIFLKRWQDLGNDWLLTPADLTILERITDLAAPLGMEQKCDAVLGHIFIGYQRLNENYWADRILLKRVHLALNANQGNQACHQLGGLFGTQNFALNSVICWEKTYSREASLDHLSELFAQAWLETGRLLHLQGQNQPALLCFDRGLGYGSASSACKSHLQMAVVQCLIELGELDAACARLAILEPDVNTTSSPANVTAWHELSAKVDLLRGKLGSAQEHLGKVWKICTQYSFVAPMLRAVTNFAQMLILVNETAEAGKILGYVHALAQKQSQESLTSRARRLLDVAGIQLYGGLERAASVIDEQLATERVERPDPALFRPEYKECYTLSHFEDRALAFYWYLGLRHWVNSRRALDRLQSFRYTDSKIILARLDAMNAMLEYYSGNRERPVKAEALLRHCSNTLLKIGLKPERWQIQVLWNRCLERLGAPADTRAVLIQENEKLLESFGESLPLQSRVTYYLDKASQLDEALASKVRKLQDVRSQIAKASLFASWRLRFALWQGLNELLDEAYWQKEAHNSGLLDDVTSSEPIRKKTSLWRRLLGCSPREATLAFLVLPDSTVGVCRRWLGLDFWVSKVTKLALRKAVGEWHKFIPLANAENRDAALRYVTQELQLDQVVRSLPKYVTKLRILPDDVLHGLPFAAVELPSFANGRYLGERFSISIAFQPEARKNKRTSQLRNGKPLLVGVTAGSKSLPPLQRTETQLLWVKQWLTKNGRDCSLILDDAASAESVLELLRNAGFFHISCHGKFVQGQPNRTGLLLRGNQLLSLPQLSKLHLQQLRHATLISCWGADNFVLPGRWILSLPEVLWRTGTGTVLASLWEIEEDVAEKFVKAFYNQLRCHRPDAALSCAQESMRKCGGKYRDVQQWAGFQIYGDPQMLSL